MTPDQKLDRRDELTLADDKLERVQKILFSRRSKGEALAQAFELVKEVRQHLFTAKRMEHSEAQR